MTCRNKKSEGFILPYVLLVITILAISTALVAEYFTQTSDLIFSLDNDTQSELAFVSAEAQVTFSLLQAGQVDGGFDLGGAVDAADEFFGNNDAIAFKDYWAINTEMRVANTASGDVFVTLQDVSGLVNLNNAPLEEIAPLLAHFGVSKEKSLSLAATLIDYRDNDNSRQFRGAERADYRLRGLAPPSNLPLRDYAELSRVLGWAEVLRAIDITTLKQYTTLSVRSASMNLNFSPPLLREIYPNLEADRDKDSGGDIFSSFASQVKSPSQRTRVTLSYISPEGVLRQRAIDIERRANNPNKPFRRFLIYNKISSDFEGFSNVVTSNELKNVIYTAFDKT